ncbi:hypothetical protein [Priestia megaterium]
MEIQREISRRGISKVYVKEKVFFNKDNLEKYIDIFQELREERHIIAESYESSKWILPCDASNGYVSFTFDIHIYREIEQALKLYTLILIRKGKAVSWTKKVFEVLKKVTFETNGFTDFSKLEKFLLDEKKAYFIARAVLAFTDFYLIDNLKEIRNICEGIREVERKNREIPPFLDIFIFSEIVNDYFKGTSIEEHLRYKPIQLWWAITNIIPMRPTDFLKLKSDCSWIDERGIYWLTLSRSKKVKQSVYDTPPLQNIRINREIYNLINQFKLDLFQIGITSDYLLPQSFYQYIKSNKKERNVVADRWHLEQFRGSLDQFQQKVVKNLYQEDYMVKIVPIHTRHLAIINLFLQGFNMLSIARMAGHEELNTQTNYYSHAENFVESYVYNLANSGVTDVLSSNLEDGFIGWRREKVDKGKKYSMKEVEEQFLKVDYGFCEDKNEFPSNCGEDCRPCPFYIFKPNINEYTKAIKWLESYSKDIKNEINVIVQSMIATSKALSTAVHPDLDESLKSQSRQLQQLMDRKIFIDYKLLEDVSYDG